MKAFRRWSGAVSLIVPALLLALAGIASATPSPAAAQAQMPYAFALVHVDLVGDPNNPTGVKISPNGQDYTTAPDGSSITMSGSGGFDPATNQVSGGGQYTIKDASGAVKAQGSWQVNSLVSFEVWPGDFDGLTVDAPAPPAGTVSSSGLGKFRVTLTGQGDGILTVTCVFPTTPESIKKGHEEGIMLTGGTFNFTHSHEEAPTGLEATVFFIPPGAAMPTGMPRTGDSSTSWALTLAMIGLAFAAAGLLVRRQVRHSAR